MTKNITNIYRATVVNLENVALDTFKLTLHEPTLSTQAKPGHFVNIKIPDCDGILWRRPFSIHNTEKQQGHFDILFKIVGKGTNNLIGRTAGEKLDIIGPLGNSFTLDENTSEAIIVAGGLGIAPFPLFLKHFERHDIKITIFYGVKTKENICCIKDMAEHVATIFYTTEDGSEGDKGYVTDLMHNYLDRIDLTGRQLFVCGPTPMLKTVRALTISYGIRAQVSVENLMACGFGACMGCAVRLARSAEGEPEYRLACKDGPVFNMDEILFND
ncbi:dihydroorotate dehydrogenase electron transfer subunit [candidate division KSB1 bacterium]|nr:dihydroorotate dehydrogenase electron transfer subunit [candidate division KSB1 bacterium]